MKKDILKRFLKCIKESTSTFNELEESILRGNAIADAMHFEDDYFMNKERRRVVGDDNEELGIPYDRRT